MAEAARRKRQLAFVGQLPTQRPHQRQAGAGPHVQIHELVHVGLEFLTQNLRCSLGASAQGSDRLLRQVALVSPCVLNSLGALGALAMYRSSKARGGWDLASLAGTAYVAALGNMGRDISSSSQPKVALALGCVLLATVELLLGHARNALLHYQAACQVYGIGDRQPGRFDDAGAENTCYALSGTDEFDAWLQSVDLSVSGYAVGMGPRWCLPRVSAPVTGLTLSRQGLFAVAQECEAWFSKNYRLKYFPALQTQEIVQQQGRLVAALRQWLQQYNSDVAPGLIITKPLSSNESLLDLQHGLQLRMLCNWLIIQTAHAFSPNPSDLDVEEQRLQQIILDAEQVTQTRLWRADIDAPKVSSWRLESSMTLGVGLIWPLCSAARAYGSRVWRRRAVRCLVQAGLEGPWNGRREAALLWRIVQHEEAWPNPPAPLATFNEQNQHMCSPASTSLTELPLLDTKVQDTHAISDTARIHDCVVPIDTRQAEGSCTAVFYRCLDVDAMVDSVQGLDPQSDFFDSKHHWQTWEEPVVF